LLPGFALVSPAAIIANFGQENICYKNVTVIPMNKEISLPDRGIVEDCIIVHR
jgi:hypothetical protein